MPRQAIPLKMEYLILGLAVRAPIYGYELLQEWQGRHHLDLIWRLKPGALYAALDKLEQQGLLSSTVVPGAASPSRNEYRITPSGEDAFSAWVKKPVASARDIRQEFMSKIFFAKDMGQESIDQLFRDQEKICQKWLSSLQSQMDRGLDFEKQVLEFRIRQVECIIAWLRLFQKPAGKEGNE